jgi:hypothetical protein
MRLSKPFSIKYVTVLLPQLSITTSLTTSAEKLNEYNFMAEKICILALMKQKKIAEPFSLHYWYIPYQSTNVSTQHLSMHNKYDLSS